jgi:hypothetical protein
MNNNSFDWELWDRYFQNSEVWKKNNNNPDKPKPNPSPIPTTGNPYNNPQINQSHLLKSSKPAMLGKIKNTKNQKSTRHQHPPLPEKLGDMFQNKPLDKEGAVLLQCIQQMIETYVNKKK